MHGARPPHSISLRGSSLAEAVRRAEHHPVAAHSDHLLEPEVLQPLVLGGQSVGAGGGRRGGTGQLQSQAKGGLKALKRQQRDAIEIVWHIHGAHGVQIYGQGVWRKLSKVDTQGGLRLAEYMR